MNRCHKAFVRIVLETQQNECDGCITKELEDRAIELEFPSKKIVSPTFTSHEPTEESLNS